jgi:hypothetical protein
MYYQQPPPTYTYAGPRYSGCLKILLYLLSFSIPIVGIVVGIIFMSKGDPESNGLGKACLFISIAAIVLWCCIGGGIAAFSILTQEGLLS